MDARDSHAPLIVALGTSLGDRERLLSQATHRMDESPGIRVVATSGVYDTTPVGGVAERRFLNAAVHLQTTLSPEALLDRLQAIETALGRTRTQRWEDRTMDLDILLWGDWVLDTERLTVPHPELHRRRFALAPAVDLAAEAMHPVLHQTLAELLEGLADPPGDCVRLDTVRLGAARPE